MFDEPFDSVAVEIPDGMNDRSGDAPHSASTEVAEYRVRDEPLALLDPQVVLARLAMKAPAM